MWYNSLGYFTKVTNMYLMLLFVKCVTMGEKMQFKIRPREGTSKWKDIPCSWIGRLNIVKMTLLPKLIYKFSVIPIKAPGGFFAKMDRLILKCIWKVKRLRIAETIL